MSGVVPAVMPRGELDERGPVVVDAHRVGPEPAAGRVVDVGDRPVEDEDGTTAVVGQLHAVAPSCEVTVAEIGRAARSPAVPSAPCRRGRSPVAAGPTPWLPLNQRTKVRVRIGQRRRRRHRSTRTSHVRPTPMPSTSAPSDHEPPAVAVHLVEQPAADLALHELRAGMGGGRVDEPLSDRREPGRRCRFFADAGRHRLVACGGLGGIGHADHLAQLHGEVDRRPCARQPLRLVGVEQRIRQPCRSARGRASRPGWRRRGGPSTCPARRTAASGERHRRRGRPGRPATSRRTRALKV